jgi:hypothetical protein
MHNRWLYIIYYIFIIHLVYVMFDRLDSDVPFIHMSRSQCLIQAKYAYGEINMIF